MYKPGDPVEISDCYGNIICDGTVKHEFISPTIGEKFYQVEVTRNGRTDLEVISERCMIPVGVRKNTTPSINFINEGEDTQKDDSKTHERDWDGAKVDSATGIPVENYVDFTGRKIL